MIKIKYSSVTALRLVVVAQLIVQLLPAQIDTSNRWLVRDFYNHVYPFGTDVQMEWTGNYDDPDSGSVSEDWLEATRMRINFYRSMAGVDPGITFDPIKNAACQDSAMIISYNQILSHFPPSNLPYWTQEGYDAANHGNIAYNSTGVDAVDGYLIDFGDTQFNDQQQIISYGNESVGHRRWILYPRGDVMGSGDVPGYGQTYGSGNTIWVQPDAVFGTRPDTRDYFVAWPPKGFVPADLVWSRWSFCYPGVDFGQATVTMTGPLGEDIPLVIDHRTTGPEVNYAPESSITWVPNGMATDKRVTWPTPASDETITVTISGMTLNNQSVDPVFYEVTIFDPNSPGNEFETALTDPGTATTYQSTEFPTTARSWSDGVQGRIFRTTIYNEVLDAESGLDPFIAQTTGTYNPVTTGRAGNFSTVYHLAHPTKDTQTLTISDSFLVSNNGPQLSFLSSLGYATEFQYGSVDINLGDGNNWKSVWAVSGPKGFENSFNQVNIDLSEWAGRSIWVRFRYQFSGSNYDSYFPDTVPDVGWAFDNISLTGVAKVIDITEYPVETPDGSITATFTDTGPVYLQARDIAFTEMDPNGFALDWGPAIEVNPTADGFSLADTVVGTWSNHPTVGWLHRVNAEWAYTMAFGWIQIDNGPWLHTGIGWARYISGNVHDGLWLYSPVEGFIYAHASRPGQYLRSPFTGEPGTWDSFTQ